jgi:hypothetical protein
VKKTTLVKWLRAIKQAVEDRARDIIEGRAQFRNRTAEEIQQIKKAAEEITDSNYWLPLFAMIDKSLAEKQALESGEFAYHSPVHAAHSPGLAPT